MSLKLHEAPFPVIDSDPIFWRVIRYFRWTDYVMGAAFASIGPSFLYIMERYQPSGYPRKQLHKAMKASLLLTGVFGFLRMYKNVSSRFFGFSENGREIRMYREEYRRRKAQGIPMDGTSRLPLSIQRISASYTTGAWINFDMLPMFNFVNHPYHFRTPGVIPEEEE
ncbi:hypothetical protein GGI25_005289 [Coemansia spiralis]|uniref:NADH-ubiquinone oxidoreductase 21kDa subunit N-terminal domain-containing protein n=2 Tax=Coemansia TaxID=4863 RepID=A0A9W8FYV5_9FUNG|nr:NADH-ubiquinone oxidoreductase complex I, 21 kDa subunit-domain-containing protein [Coemansia spiralis]KAJ1988486.1 hypothetical protein EDC05_005260 [Coemansia umbellata]KAJ2619765.1 hypothetical protein GGI26_005575 [Coemansia sp. RSA 1358]KAJ2671946.1 hypothetical protein GGI25_005289 [Coemansia spiralis]